jgi:hypothetical protein
MIAKTAIKVIKIIIKETITTKLLNKKYQSNWEYLA